jgi:hypothetical protein
MFGTYAAPIEMTAYNAIAMNSFKDLMEKLITGNHPDINAGLRTEAEAVDKAIAAAKQK